MEDKEESPKELSWAEDITIFILKCVLDAREKEKLSEDNVIFVNLRKLFLVLSNLL